MRHGSLFSGIGGFDLAAEWMGWENVFHCEWNDFGKQVLKYYWPNSISYDDITKTDFTIHRGEIDILTGGFPCQPYSAAGKRLGKEDDRHLWPEMLRAIREIQPTFVVGENVRGLTNWNGGLVFNEVQADLEANGYEVTPFLLPACAVNAPHRRDRIWFVAYLHNQRQHGFWSECRTSEGERETNRIKTFGEERPTSDTDNSRAREQLRTDRNGQEKNEGRERQPGLELGEIGGDVADTNNERLERFFFGPGKTKRTVQKKRKPISGINNRGNTWHNFPTQSPICGGDDGLPTKLDRITFPKWRNESIKAYGNAIVPQVAHEIFKAINKSLSYDSNI